MLSPRYEFSLFSLRLVPFFYINVNIILKFINWDSCDGKYIAFRERVGNIFWTLL